jgi:hypothetical protein
MYPESENPSGAEPEATEAMDQLRDGIARVRVIVREAKQAIGHAPPEGAVLPSDPEPDGPILKAD